MNAREPLKYKAAIFFDNDADYIADVRRDCPRINAVKVSALDIIRDIDYNKEPLAGFIREREGDGPRGNFYVNMMKLNKKPTDLYDHEGGFDVVADKEILDQWIVDTEGLEPRVALFDWDQTLSKFGAIELDALQYPAANYEHILLYLLGGRERLAAIRQMFKDLQAKRVHAIILTNNGASRFKEFRSMVGLLGRVRVIYSGAAPYHGDKGKTLRDMEEFSEMCIGLSGGKLSGRKRSRTKYRRQTYRKHSRTGTKRLRKH